MSTGHLLSAYVVICCWKATSVLGIPGTCQHNVTDDYEVAMRRVADSWFRF